MECKQIAEEYNLAGWYKVKYFGDVNEKKLVEKYNKDPNVEIAELNYIGHITDWPLAGY